MSGEGQQPCPMAETSNKVLGKSKQAVGRATGDRGLEAEGKVQHTTGKAQGAVKDASRNIEHALGSMGQKLAANRRTKAGMRPERDRLPRRELDKQF